MSIDEHNLRKESMSREVLRHKEFEGCVELKRIRDWFICEWCLLFSVYSQCANFIAVTVESEGPYAPEALFPESVRVMREKIANIRRAAEALLADADGGGGVGADGDVEMAGV